MNAGILWALIFGLVMACAALAGYMLADQRAAERIRAADSAAAVCADQVQAKVGALDQLRGQLADLRARHAAALAAATAALDARDAEIITLTQAAAARAAAIRSAAHEHPDVAALAGLPVPAALARQLWPVPATAGAAATADGNH